LITVLTGGTGGAKFVEGVAKNIDPKDLTCVVNTGDDMRWWGLYVSPDLDSITYALAGLLSRERGWGLEGETFNCLKRMGSLGAEAWFQIGDLDLATHLRRTELMSSGLTLSDVTRKMAAALNVTATILPMSNASVETRVRTPHGELSFEEYFVRERYQSTVLEVHFVGAGEAKPAPGVIDAIQKAEIVLLAPSNPVTSIGPILSIPGVRDSLRTTPAPVVAVSPIVAGAAVSGPSGNLMRAMDMHNSAAGVAEAYRDFIDVLIIDDRDAGESSRIEELGVHPFPTQALMRTPEEKTALARAAIEAARQHARKTQGS
jgi:LPPG:FO 2-phospho-L-lactate transferase